MKKYVFKGSTKNVQTKRAKNMLDETTWKTFRDGDSVSEELVDLVKSHGGVVEEVKVVKETVSAKPKKKAVKKKAVKKKS